MEQHLQNERIHEAQSQSVHCLGYVLTEVPLATAEEAVTGDVSDMGDDDGELSPDDGDGGGLLDEEEAEEDPETGVICQRSKPEPVSELTKLVRPDPTAELISQVLELR